MIKRLLIAFGAVNLWIMLCALSAQETIRLAANKVTDYQIVLPDNPSLVQKTAAEELATYLNKITGAHFPIQNESEVEIGPQQCRLMIGPSPTVEKLLVQAGLPGEADYGYDAARVEQIGSTIVFTGHAVRGPIYAVDTFLEEYLGCRWWTAYEETVPQNDSPKLENVHYFHTPVLYSRESDSAGLIGDETRGRFAAHLKYNGAPHPVPEEFGGHISFQYFVHSFYILIPPEKYFLDHPEWFPEINGRRVAGRPEWWSPGKEYQEFVKKLQPEQVYSAGTQLCLSNDELAQEMAKNAIEALNEHPEANIISISQNDCGGECACEKCRAINEEEESPSGTLIRFVNRVAEEIEKVHPNVYVETLAYQQTRKPPKMTKARKNVIVRLCSIECSFNEPLAESEFNADFKNDIVGWGDKADHLFIWDYVTNYGHYLMPFPDINILGDNIRFFIDNHTIGIFEETDSNHQSGDFVQLRNWIIGKLLWDPSLDQGKLMDEFIAGYYAPELVPIYRSYFDMLEQSSLDANAHICCFEKSSGRWLDNDRLNQITRLMNQAQEIAAELAVKDPERYAALPEKVLRERIPLDLIWLQRWNIMRYESSLFGTEFLGPKDPQVLAEEFIQRLARHKITAPFACIPSPDEMEVFTQTLLDCYNPEDTAPLPEMFRNLPENTVFDWQQSAMSAERPGAMAFYKKDPNASNGKAFSLPGNISGPALIVHTESLMEVFEKEKNPNLTKVHIYAYLRSDPWDYKEKRFSVGVSSSEKVLFSHEIPMTQIEGDQYQMIDLGTVEPQRDLYIWFLPNADSWNSDPEKPHNLWVDRVILVRE